MSSLFKYKIDFDNDSTQEESYEQSPAENFPNLALILVATIILSFFSTIVMVLDYCFPDCLDGTYLKLFF